jgi:hypothetical protein
MEYAKLFWDYMCVEGLGLCDSTEIIWKNALGYVREDTISKKVYKRNGAYEYLLYDFDLSIGDTFDFGAGYVATVINIDSILTNEGYRKTITLESPFNIMVWAEGIGNLANPLNPSEEYDYDLESILCYYENNELIYDTTQLISFDCEVVEPFIPTITPDITEGATLADVCDSLCVIDIYINDSVLEGELAIVIENNSSVSINYPTFVVIDNATGDTIATDDGVFGLFAILGR